MHYGIGVGSKTSTGGEVIEGNSSVIFDGMVASSIGHMATCKACKEGIGPIVGVGPREIWLPAGLAAKSGDYVACGCPPGTNVLLPAGTIGIGTYGAAAGAPVKAPVPAAEIPSRYTVTVYAAAPGTPLKDSPNEPSAAGHMWLGITELKADGAGDEKSFGFGPRKTGIRGPGHVITTDSKNYIDPYYSRTMEITKSQYEKLLEFGKTAVDENEKYFNLYYKGESNSCIDFTNTALRFAGLNPIMVRPTTPSLQYPNVYEDKEYEGTLKVLDNIAPIQRIPAPLPNSELNKEHYNEMPERTILQRFLSQQGSDHGSGGATT